MVIFLFSQQDEAEKFDYIFTHYNGVMLRKAYNILGDHMLSEDAVSEAFIRIYKNLHKIGNPSSGKTAAFVVTIVKNVALTMLKKESRFNAMPLDETEPDEFVLEDFVVSQMTSERVISIMDQLAEEFRAVFILRYAYDMSYREIGKALGINENVVTVRLHRAKKILCEILAAEGVV